MVAPVFVGTKRFGRAPLLALPRRRRNVKEAESLGRRVRVRASLSPLGARASRPPSRTEQEEVGQTPSGEGREGAGRLPDRKLET